MRTADARPNRTARGGFDPLGTLPHRFAWEATDATDCHRSLALGCVLIGAVLHALTSPPAPPAPEPVEVARADEATQQRLDRIGGRLEEVAQTLAALRVQRASAPPRPAASPGPQLRGSASAERATASATKPPAASFPSRSSPTDPAEEANRAAKHLAESAVVVRERSGCGRCVSQADQVCSVGQSVKPASGKCRSMANASRTPASCMRTKESASV